jgi:hypothetical protein
MCDFLSEITFTHNCWMPFRCFLQEKESYCRQHDLWEKKRREALNSKDAEKQLLELPAAPIAPLQPYMICEEPSYEGLVELFNIGQPTAGIFSDDGARLVGGISAKRSALGWFRIRRCCSATSLS